MKTAILILLMAFCCSCETSFSKREFKIVKAENARLHKINDSLITLLSEEKLSTLVVEPYLKTYDVGDTVELMVGILYNRPHFIKNIVAENFTEDRLDILLDTKSHIPEYSIKPHFSDDRKNYFEFEVTNLHEGNNYFCGYFDVLKSDGILKKIPFKHIIKAK